MNGGIHLNSNLLKLDYIINIDKLQKIQDDIAKVTDMALLTVDYKGIPFTKHSGCSEFCKIVRTHPSYSKLCEKCDSRGGLEAARMQQPYIYLCHIGLVDFAIPIIVDDQYLGAVMAGQIRLKENNEKKNLEKIVNDQYYNINLNVEDELSELFNKLPVITLEKIESVSRMMLHMIDYILEEAVLKTELLEFNQRFFSLNNPEISPEYAEKYANLFKKENSKFVDLRENFSHELKEEKSLKASKKISPLLKPALEYIDKNYNEKISLNKMASVCNISTSYFSKLFKRELGENFTDYVNRVKIIKAKDLLESTDAPIINISLNLGFDDCGYFIKVFKKNEGVTPAVYRKNANS